LQLVVVEEYEEEEDAMCFCNTQAYSILKKYAKVADVKLFGVC
jgi:hypothetical protein